MSELPIAPGGNGASPFDSIRRVNVDRITGEQREYWSARELQPMLGYDTWRNFSGVIDDAKIACANTGGIVLDHFVGANKLVEIGKGGTRALDDFHLSRYACYLVAMNGSPRIPTIAAAQRYFAYQTYRAEQSLPPINPSDGQPLPIHPTAARPWATRFEETFGNHYRHVQMNHPAGSFSVVTAGLMQMMIMEDQLIRHLMPIRSGDRPCISIGLTWSNWLKRENKGVKIGESPIYLPDQDMDVPVSVYGGELRVTFDYWLHNIYLINKLPEYLDRKPDFKDCGALPRASAADCTARQLTGKGANIAAKLAFELERKGGFVPALPGGKPPPALPG